MAVRWQVTRKQKFNIKIKWTNLHGSSAWKDSSDSKNSRVEKILHRPALAHSFYSFISRGSLRVKLSCCPVAIFPMWKWNSTNWTFVEFSVTQMHRNFNFQHDHNIDVIWTVADFSKCRRLRSHGLKLIIHCGNALKGFLTGLKTCEWLKLIFHILLKIYKDMGLTYRRIGID